MGTYFSSSWTLCLHAQGPVAAWFNQPLHFVISFAGSAREKQCCKPMLKVEAFPLAVLRQKDLTLGQVSSPKSSKSSEMSNHPFQLPGATHQQEETAHWAHLQNINLYFRSIPAQLIVLISWISPVALNWTGFKGGKNTRVGWCIQELQAKGGGRCVSAGSQGRGRNNYYAIKIH